MKPPGYQLPERITPLSPVAPYIRAAAVAGAPDDGWLDSRPRGVVNQQRIPCCVSCALASAMETLHPSWPALAPLFHYYVTRYDEGVQTSAGSLPLDDIVIGALGTRGICQFVDHPMTYTEAGANTPPSAAAYNDAKGRQLGWNGASFSYQRIIAASRVVAIRDAIRRNQPVVIGFRLPTTYPGGFLDSQHEWVEADVNSVSADGHCVLVVGFSDARQALRIHDCQGADRFDAGGWWMGYRIADSGVVVDAFTLT
jgi:hypothetical protein